MDILGTLLTNLPLAALAGILAGFLRNLAGYLENYLKDGKLDKFEIKQLAGTMIKYFAYVTLLSFGLPLGESVVAAFGIDIGQSVIKNAKE